VTTIFTIYVNDSEEGTEGTVAKFADDTKICRGTDSIDEAEDCRRTWTGWESGQRSGRCNSMWKSVSNALWKEEWRHRLISKWGSA